MIGLIRFLLPYRDPAGREPGAHGSRSRPRAFLRVVFRVSLFVLAAAAVLAVGLPALDPVAMWRWLDDSWVLLLLVRICVYVAAVWWGPLIRGARGADLDRARLALAGFAAALEGIGFLWMVL